MIKLPSKAVRQSDKQTISKYINGKKSREK